MSVVLFRLITTSDQRLEVEAAAVQSRAGNCAYNCKNDVDNKSDDTENKAKRAEDLADFCFAVNNAIVGCCILLCIAACDCAEDDTQDGTSAESDGKNTKNKRFC